ncbi:hypothetical protein [Streptomyces sp. NPDC055243]|uniref:hypothetical protein n=1 Tax=Streptomyces sp. NPDC055243 TaxID=3365720 RepID=UPI0037CECB87
MRSLVTTRALLAARQDLTGTINARAMMSLYGGASFGKTVAATGCLRELEASEDVRRITFHTRATTRAVRHELHVALQLPGRPPRYVTEFDHLLKAELATYVSVWSGGVLEPRGQGWR